MKVPGTRLELWVLRPIHGGALQYLRRPLKPVRRQAARLSRKRFGASSREVQCRSTTGISDPLNTAIALLNNGIDFSTSDVEVRATVACFLLHTRMYTPAESRRVGQLPFFCQRSAPMFCVSATNSGFDGVLPQCSSNILNNTKPDLHRLMC